MLKSDVCVGQIQMRRGKNIYPNLIIINLTTSSTSVRQSVNIKALHFHKALHLNQLQHAVCINYAS